MIHKRNHSDKNLILEILLNRFCFWATLVVYQRTVDIPTLFSFEN